MCSPQGLSYIQRSIGYRVAESDAIKSLLQIPKSVVQLSVSDALKCFLPPLDCQSIFLPLEVFHASVMKMLGRRYWIFFGIILAAAFILRVLPIRFNNFYFTMDQAEDALHVRDFLTRGQWPLVGPATNINNLFAGPGWYYVIAIGYALSGGHPVGALIEVILLSIVVLAVIMLKVKQEVSPVWSLLVGGALLTSWTLFDTSRYAFNPFPLTLLSFLLIFSLCDMIAGKQMSYLWAALWVGLGFHAEVAGSIALSLFYAVVTIWALFRRRVSWRVVAAGVSVVILLFIPFFVSEYQSGFLQTRVIGEQFGSGGVFTGAAVSGITKTVHEGIVKSTFRQIPELGLALFCVIIVVVWYRRIQHTRINRFIYRYSTLSFVLLIVSWVFFSTNNGWRQWHTLFLSPVIFVMILLLLHEMDRKLAIALFVISLYSHIAGFIPKYLANFYPTSDASILHNELAAIDWVYGESHGLGFSVYNYLPSVYDFPYQYLFWWYGRKTYGYLPCEYASYPGAPKLIIPGATYYMNPIKSCTNLRFLIIEPDDQRSEYRRRWIDAVSQKSTLVTRTTIGTITIEKRQVTQ